MSGTPIPSSKPLHFDKNFPSLLPDKKFSFDLEFTNDSSFSHSSTLRQRRCLLVGFDESFASGIFFQVFLMTTIFVRLTNFYIYHINLDWNFSI